MGIDYLFFKHKFNIQTIIGFIIAVIGLSISIYFSNKK
jgi:drug/metabolite transporter (DMT)-like permease